MRWCWIYLKCICLVVSNHMFGSFTCFVCCYMFYWLYIFLLLLLKSINELMTEIYICPPINLYVCPPPSIYMYVCPPPLIYMYVCPPPPYTCMFARPPPPYTCMSPHIHVCPPPHIHACLPPPHIHVCLSPPPPIYMYVCQLSIVIVMLQSMWSSGLASGILVIRDHQASITFRQLAGTI